MREVYLPRHKQKMKRIKYVSVEHVDAASRGGQLQRKPKSGLWQREHGLESHSRQLHGQWALIYLPTYLDLKLTVPLKTNIYPLTVRYLNVLKWNSWLVSKCVLVFMVSLGTATFISKGVYLGMENFITILRNHNSIETISFVPRWAHTLLR